MLPVRLQSIEERNRYRTYCPHENEICRSAQCLINALTGQVGTGSHLSGNPTYQELATYCWTNQVRRLLPLSVSYNDPSLP